MRKLQNNRSKTHKATDPTQIIINLLHNPSAFLSVHLNVSQKLNEYLYRQKILLCMYGLYYFEGATVRAL